MCKSHKNADNLQILNLDFDDKNFFDNLPINYFDTIISSSSIQWSKNIDRLFCEISKHTTNISFAIFTSNTFKEVQQFTNLPSPIYNKEDILKYANCHFNLTYKIEKYKKTFKHKTDIFKHIKNSGVSGGKKRLSIKETKNLLNNFPYNYLQYEVLFIKGIAKKVA
jgi:malonyl-CoA O-methyltransferase